MGLAKLIQQLDELEEQYQEWVAPINQVIRESSYKVNRDGYTPADLDVKAVREKQQAKYDPYQTIYRLLDEICPAYLEASFGGIIWRHHRNSEPGSGLRRVTRMGC